MAYSLCYEVSCTQEWKRKNVPIHLTVSVVVQLFFECDISFCILNFQKLGIWIYIYCWMKHIARVPIITTFIPQNKGVFKITIFVLLLKQQILIKIFGTYSAILCLLLILYISENKFYAWGSSYATFSNPSFNSKWTSSRKNKMKEDVNITALFSGNISS